MSISFELQDMMSVLVDNELGIIEEVAKVRLQPDDAPMHIGASIWQNHAHISPNTRGFPIDHPVLVSGEGDRQGTGVGLDHESCLWSTIGEAVERYSASIINLDLLTRSKGSDLDGVVLPPENLIGFSEEQYKHEDFAFSRPTMDTELFWMKGVRYPDGAEAWVPADCAFVQRTEPSDTIFDKGYSTGLGAGTNPEMAALTALREVVERDAYVCHWLTKTCGPHISLEQARNIVDPEYLPFLDRNELQISIIDITTDIGIPCVLTMMRGAFFPGIASGASCNASLKTAIQKSLLECWHTFNWLIDLNRWTKSAERDEIFAFIDHVSHYLEPERRNAVDFLMEPLDLAFHSGVAPDVQMSAKEELRHIIGQLTTLEYEVYFADVSAPDVAQLGWNVVRAVVPGLQPMYAGTGFEHRDTRRLAKFLDWKGTSLHELNGDPHPFP